MTTTTETAPPATTTTTPAAGETPPAAGTTPAKKAIPNPVKSIERQIAKAVKMIAEGQGTAEECALFTKAWKGLEVLIQTIGQTTDPLNPPAPGSAWDVVLKLAAGEDKVASMFVPGPRDAF